MRMFTEEGPDQDRIIREEVEYAREKSEKINAGALDHRGELTSELVEYYHLNMAHEDLIRRLYNLCERFHGPTPEQPAEEKSNEPNGVLMAIRHNNRKHGQNLEEISNLISTLESSI